MFYFLLGMAGWGEGGREERRGYMSIPSPERKCRNNCSEWQEACETTELSDSRILFMLFNPGSRIPATFAFVR